MSGRPIDRKLLASFIEYVSNGVITPLEWHRFAVNHYADPVMERARSECVRISHVERDPKHISIEHRNSLLLLAKELRGSA
jgi:hypothetical protein